MVRITPDPSWKEGSKQSTHVVSIDRLKLYHGDTTLIPNKEVDIEMSNDEFAEHLHLAGSSSDKGWQNKGALEGKKEEGNKEESEDDSKELGPSPPPRPTAIRSGQNTPRPTTAHTPTNQSTVS